MEPIEKTFYNAFWDFIKACLPDEDVYLRDSNFNPPKGPYTVIKITDIEPVTSRRIYESSPDDNGRTSSYSEFIGTCSLYTYGEYSISRAQSIAVGFRERLTKNILKEYNLSYIQSSPVRNASRALSKERIEERAQFSVEFYFAQGGPDRGGDDPSIIEKINTSGAVIDNDEEFNPFTEPSLILDFTNLDYQVFEGSVFYIDTSSFFT